MNTNMLRSTKLVYLMAALAASNNALAGTTLEQYMTGGAHPPITVSAADPFYTSNAIFGSDYGYSGSSNYGFVSLSSGKMRASMRAGVDVDTGATVSFDDKFTFTQLSGFPQIIGNGKDAVLYFKFHGDTAGGAANDFAQYLYVRVSGPIERSYLLALVPSDCHGWFLTSPYNGTPNETFSCEVGNNINQIGIINIPLISNSTTTIQAKLVTRAALGAHADFGNTASFFIDLPEGVGLISESGVLFSDASPVPEPPMYQLAILGTLLLTQVVRRLRYASV